MMNGLLNVAYTFRTEVGVFFVQKYYRLDFHGIKQIWNKVEQSPTKTLDSILNQSNIYFFTSI